MERKYVIGYTHPKALLMDYDNTGLDEVKKESAKIARKHKLNKYIITKTRNRGYHVIYDKTIGYKRVCEIISHSKCYSQERHLLRKFRGDTTLRISKINSKYRKRDNPKVVYTSTSITFFRKNGVVMQYLDWLEAVKQNKL